MLDAAAVAGLVSAFSEHSKSRELVLLLLEHTPAPFSRAQFAPGHITATGLVLHPDRDAFLLIHHKRLNRWLLPGGHVERDDPTIEHTARREVAEETGAILSAGPAPLAGIDVHGIPVGKGEPYHLHHDLIFAFRAVCSEVAPTEEVRQVTWCEPVDWDRFNLPMSIRQAAHFAFASR